MKEQAGKIPLGARLKLKNIKKAKEDKLAVSISYCVLRIEYRVKKIRIQELRRDVIYRF